MAHESFPQITNPVSWPKSVISLFPPDQSSRKLSGQRIALVGTYAPRKCGIATFTADVHRQIGRHHPDTRIDVYALDRADSSHSYTQVADVLRTDIAEDYARVARRINESGVDAVWVQHEFGIFGGHHGDAVCGFVERIAAPLILTFHTVLSRPDTDQRRVMRHLVSRASRIMVMSHHSRDLVISEYGAAPASVHVIPHGAPDRPFGREDLFKARLGHEGRPVLMTFGLLGRGKGLEHVIRALPGIVARYPRAIYRIVGATHPNLVAQEGERYREELQELACKLGVDGHIEWDNRFLDTDELLDQLEACDIFLTPYPNLQQSTSGALSYAVALGKAVIATPYLHAKELLADGAGLLVQPDSPEEIRGAITALLDDPQTLRAVKQRAYQRGRATIWPEFAAACHGMIAEVVRAEADEPPPAAPALSAVFAMSDGTGILQHSIGIVPDRRHGYCVDDNARALMLMNVAQALPEMERARWSAIYASFIQHAWNADMGRFRNFMAYDRQWCEAVGSEDSNGRALWALGHTAERARDPMLRQWAADWFEVVSPPMAGLGSPRAISFAMLGAAAIARVTPAPDHAMAVLERGGRMLDGLLHRTRRPDWCWFESVLGYDNPRISQALIEAGVECGRSEWVASGLQTLEWITHCQLGARGHFRAIGSDTFHQEYASLPFDQQPLEAWAAIDAARAAYLASGDARWVDYASTAYRWYFGANDRGIVLADMKSGRCHDGVTPRGVNGNCGAESILAFHLAHYALVELDRLAQPGIAMGHDIDRTSAQSASNPRH